MSTDKFVVMSQKMAGFLMMRGFVLRGLGANHRYRNRNVFFFNNTPQLHEAIAEYQLTNGGLTNGEQAGTLRTDG